VDIARKLSGGEWQTHLDHSIPQQLRAGDPTAGERCLVPEASPAPALWVLQRLRRSPGLQFQVLTPTSTGSCGLQPWRSAVASARSFPRRAPGCVSAVRTRELGFPRAAGERGGSGHLPPKRTPLHCLSEPEPGKLRSLLTRLVLFPQGSQPDISPLFSLS